MAACWASYTTWYTFLIRGLHRPTISGGVRSEQYPLWTAPQSISSGWSRCTATSWGR